MDSSSNSEQTKGYRLIAPRQTDQQQQQPQMPQSSNPDEGKTKRASMACLECKKRRTKCSTGNPCSECAAHQRECIYDQTADKRRKEHVLSTRNQLVSTEANLRYYHSFLEDLLASLRLGNKDELDNLIQVIQETSRNPDPEDRTGYTQIREAMFSILGDFEDAEGSDEASDIDQSVPNQPDSDVQ